MQNPVTPTEIAHRYRLINRLGAGGMGEVYRAYDRLTGQFVALKKVLVAPDQLAFNSRESGQTDLRLALTREFESLAALRHPHIITVLDYGFSDEKTPFLTMDLLHDAKPLDEAMQGKARSEQMALFVQVLRALSYLHQYGIIHRDLKPGNILVAADSVKVLDFGLAISKEYTGEAAGTLHYLAPEVLEGNPPSPVSDLYAFGVVMYQILCQRLPFDTLNFTQLLNLILTKPVNVDDIESDLSAIVKRLLEKDPHDRFEDARSVITALNEAIGTNYALETFATRESFLQAAPLVGRAAEFRVLESALHEASVGQGEVWLVGGESGVGKTRLLDELRTRALVRGALVVTGQAISEGGNPYHVWRGVARRLALSTSLSDADTSLLKILIPDIQDLLERPVAEPPLLDPQVIEARLFSAISAMIQQQKQPVLIILEDLHWADDESLALLVWLTDQLAHDAATEASPVLVLGSYRDDERPLALSSAIHRLKLNRLPEEEIATLSVAMLGDNGRSPDLVSLLVKETEGNAYFLVETMRALADDAGALDQIGRVTLPMNIFAGGVQQTIMRRLNRIPPENRRLLTIAAIIGRQIDSPLLEALSAGTNLDQWLAECTAAFIIEFRAGQGQFAHDKLREALLSQLSPEERWEIHRHVAQAMEQVSPKEGPYVTALVYHWSDGRRSC